MDVLENPPRSSLDKPLPEIRAPLADDMSNLAIEDAASVDQQVRNALTDPRIFETIPAVIAMIVFLNPGLLAVFRPRQTARRRGLFIPRRSHRISAPTRSNSRVKDNTTSSFSEHNISSPPNLPLSPPQIYGPCGSSAQNPFVFSSPRVSRRWN